jgi:hypothetical protein
LFKRGSVIHLLLFAASLSVCALVWLRERRLRGRGRLLGEILDLADALERELLECRARLRQIPALAIHLRLSGQPAPALPTVEPLVQEGLRDLLGHRLWLKEHAASASCSELLAARDALAATRGRLATQRIRLTEAYADLAPVSAAAPRTLEAPQ